MIHGPFFFLRHEIIPAKTSICKFSYCFQRKTISFILKNTVLFFLVISTQTQCRSISYMNFTRGKRLQIKYLTWEHVPPIIKILQINFYQKASQTKQLLFLSLKPDLITSHQNIKEECSLKQSLVITPGFLKECLWYAIC